MAFWTSGVAPHSFIIGEVRLIEAHRHITGQLAAECFCPHSSIVSIPLSIPYRDVADRNSPVEEMRCDRNDEFSYLFVSKIQSNKNPEAGNDYHNC